MLVFLSPFGGLAYCRMLVERGGKKKKETESDSSKWSCRRKVMFCLLVLVHCSLLAMNGHCTAGAHAACCNGSTWVAGAMGLRFW